MTLVLVVTLLAAMLAGGAVVLGLASGNTKGATLAKKTREALYCAEAGLAAARDFVINNQDDWEAVLDGNPDNNPAWYPNDATLGEGIHGSYDWDSVNDYTATMEDDGDGDGDPTKDANQTVIIKSTCLKFPDAPAQVMEVIAMGGQTGDYYGDQKGQGPSGVGQIKELVNF